MSTKGGEPAKPTAQPAEKTTAPAPATARLGGLAKATAGNVAPPNTTAPAAKPEEKKSVDPGAKGPTLKKPVPPINTAALKPETPAPEVKAPTSARPLTARTEPKPQEAPGSAQKRATQSKIGSALAAKLRPLGP